MDYSEARNILDTGDIVLFSGRGVFSAVIRKYTGCKWSHVGTILRPKDMDILLIMESTTLSNIRDMDTQEFTKGVQVVPFSERCKTYDGDIGFRHINVARGAAFNKIVNDFRHEMKGKPYEEDTLQLIRAAYDGILGTNEKDLSSLFCSELVAELWQRLGWLDNILPSNEFDPSNFAGIGTDNVDQFLAEGLKLDHVIEINGEGVSHGVA